MRTQEEFEQVFQSAVDIVGQPSSRSDRRHNYKQLFFEIIDNTNAMLKERFADCESFGFLDLVNPNSFSSWNSVPEDKLLLLKSKYGSLFNLSALSSQLLFLYKDSDFKKESSTMGVLKSIYDINIQRSTYSRCGEAFEMKCCNISVKCICRAILFLPEKS